MELFKWLQAVLCRWLYFPGCHSLCSILFKLNTSIFQVAAQATLQTGWSILLPTAEERAKALSSLLPSTGITFPL